MNIKRAVVTLAATICLSLPALAGGAGGSPLGGWDRNSDYNQHFSTRNLVTLTGKVTRVDRNAHPLQGMDAGLVATIKTDSGEMAEIQVGPTWFTQFYHPKWNIQTGDQITVTGSRVSLGGHPVVMVVTGQKGALKLTVRNQQGSPIWDFPAEGF